MILDRSVVYSENDPDGRRAVACTAYCPETVPFEVGLSVLLGKRLVTILRSREMGILGNERFWASYDELCIFSIRTEPTFSRSPAYG